MLSDYLVNIAWSAEDNEYVATCPAFPGLSALGGTQEEALAQAHVALRMFVATMNGKGWALPSPMGIAPHGQDTVEAS